MFCVAHDGSAYQPVPCDEPGALLVMTHLELAQHSPFYLSAENALQIGGAMLLGMVFAFCLRQIRILITSAGESSNNE